MGDVTGKMKVFVNARNFLSLMSINDCTLENELVDNNEEIFRAQNRYKIGNYRMKESLTTN